MFSSLDRFPQKGDCEASATTVDQAMNSQLKILVVEDDQQTQAIMRLILARYNYKMTIVSNGQEAVQAVKMERFDLIFMDVFMPIMDGLDATRCIRQWENGTGHVPIIGTTAIFESEHRRCLEAGMDAVVWKPFDSSQIYQVISVFVKGNGSIKSKNGNPPRPQLTEFPILDVPSAIDRLGGDREAFEEALDAFISSLPQKSNDLRDNFDAGNWHTLSILVHNLKGLSASLGAMQLSRKAEKLDRQLSQGQFENTEQLLQEIEFSVHALQTMAMELLEQF